ncbi:hypothetical protein ACFL6S_27750 [Candidatus Poribacteria bacterium]
MRIFQWTGSFLLFVFLVSLANVQSLGAEAIDEFDLPKLNEELWEMMTVGNASSKIEDGILTMTSPGVDSGAMVYYPVDVENVDITFEVKLDTSGLVDNITVGFIAELMEPQVNTDINNHWEANFFFVPANWYIKQDPVVIGQKPPNPAGMEGPFDPGWNVVKIDCSESKGKITFFLNDEEVGEVDKNPDVKSRYFYVTCDPYTSHYSGEVAIEYIKMSGPGAPNLAVEPTGKLATTWAKMKSGH